MSDSLLISLMFTIILFLFMIIDYLIIKLEIIQNIDLFYCLHKKLVDKEIKKIKK